MGKRFFFNTLLTLLSTATLFFSALSQSTTPNGHAEKEITTWYNAYQWLGGLQLVPHSSVNQQEFERQYRTNPIWWDKTFEFLKTHDLADLVPGRYVIDQDNVIAFVSEVSTKNKNEVAWETHANFNDLQYIIKGKAKMGVTSITNSSVKVAVPYNDKSDTETYTLSGGEYYDAEQGAFFIFSPKDIHRPAFKAKGYDVVKKILIKVRVP